MMLKQAMDLMLPAVEEELKLVVGRTTADHYPQLRGMLTYHMGWEGEGAGPEAQGKRIRPLLVLLCAQACGADWHSALPAAAAVELIHNFSLIHDDIQDQSPLRRSRPTVWVKWGQAQAINAGDVMFTQAFVALNDLARTVSPDTALEAGRILQQTCLRLTEGQYLDISYETRADLGLVDYWPMIGGKTSALLACCAELGALAGGAGAERRADFREFGFSLGLAFQVLDDWLGIWGDAAMTGKSTDSDLVSGKKSLPVLFALAKNGTFARRWAQAPIQPQDVPGVVRLLEAEGAQEFTLAEAERLTGRALDALQRAAPVQADPLRELTGVLLTRKH
jgi:geranylgeranyl diphosphate synthase type I